ncbi:MAG: hypothetical protein KC502_09425 [Myxococcales bacterium]|nr:hypothetical protein [Myxococcales bacterium]
MTSHDHEHFEILMMKQVDGFIDAAERAELQAHTTDCATCRAELRSFTDLKTTTDAMRQRLLDDVAQDPLRPDLPTRAINTVGFLALVSAAVLCCGWIGWLVWTDPKIPEILRVGLLLAGGIGLGVFLNVLRLRLRAAPTDPYREIDR